MLALFRINDPFRLVIAFIILALFRLPFWIEETPFLLEELKWLLIGEKVALGGMMYKDIWDSTGIFSVGVYWLIHLFVGKSPLTYQIIALLLIAYQAIIFNQLMIKKTLFKERNYIPALVYVVLASLSFDMLTLSPELMTITVLLLITRNFLNLNEPHSGDDMVFSIGFYLGVAIALDLSNVIFFIYAFIGFTLFRTPSVRYYLLMFYGVLIVSGAVMLYYFWNNAFPDFFANHLSLLFQLGKNTVALPQQWFWITGFALIVLLLAVFRTFSERGFINFQVNSQYMMLMWLFFGVLNLIFAESFHFYRLVLILPPMTFFLCHFLLLIKRKIVAEFVFLCLLVNIGFNIYWVLRRENFSKNNYEIVVKNESPYLNKKVLVLSDNLSFYHQNTLATPYLDWELAQKHFGNLAYYNVVLEIYDNFLNDKPQVIIDEKGFVPQLFTHLPLLKQQYERDKNNPKIYVLIKK